MRYSIFCVATSFIPTALFAHCVDAAEVEIARRKRVVIVQPVVLSDDEGQNPAPIDLPRKLVNRVYTKADLEFLYLPPRSWAFKEGRDGKINLDTIVKRGISEKIISTDKRVVTLLFVSAVDGQAKPLGRGLQNGNICFVCLGPKPEANDPALAAFVVAHEIGHCLNLRHAVDDPNVPDDVHNLQGDGPFEKRLAVDGLHDSQRDTVLQSPLVNDRILFNSLNDSKSLLTDETWDPYITKSTDDMLRFSIGLPMDSTLSKNSEDRFEYAKERYQRFASEFTSEEQKMLTSQISELNRLVGADWPLLTRFPWNLIKVDDGFCQNRPHTRGLSIVLSSRVLQRMNNDFQYAMTLLVHEKLHVLQRVCPHAFENLYTQYGYRPIDLSHDQILEKNLAQNPDAFSRPWGFLLDGQLHLLATRVISSGNRPLFQEALFEVEQLSDGEYRIKGESDLKTVEAWKNRFAVPYGHDHPNEISAHSSKSILIRHYLNRKKADKLAKNGMVESTRSEFNVILGSPVTAANRLQELKSSR